PAPFLSTVRPPTRPALLPYTTLFRSDLQAQAVSHSNHGFTKHQVVIVSSQIPDEALIDLDVIDVEAFEIGHGGIAGAKLVQRDLHAGVSEFDQFLRRLSIGVHEQSLGDFHHNMIALHAQLGQMCQPVPGVQAVTGKLNRRNINARLQFGAEVAPYGDLICRRPEYPLAYPVDQATVL